MITGTNGGDYLTINERVRTVRNALGLTQIDFGKRLAVAQSYLTNIETGKREVTEKIQKLICLEFNVSEEWLLTGKGEMFVESDSTIISQLSDEYGLDSFEKIMIEGFLKLKPNERKVIKSYVCYLMEKVFSDESAYLEFRAEYDKDHVLPFAARHGDVSGLAEAVDLYESTISDSNSDNES